MFEYRELEYSPDTLAGFLSKETLGFHHGKHLKTYIETANKLIAGTPYEKETIEQIIANAPEGPLFNNVAQIYNHLFYFNCISPGERTVPATLKNKIEETFGSVEDFLSKFISSALANFGSGWTWLVRDSAGKLSIIDTKNAGCPLRQQLTPLLTVDVWEHAYYLDYQNRRADYLKTFSNFINWSFVNKQ